MRSIRIGICSRDDRYAANLAMAIGRESGGRIRVQAICGPEKLSEMIMEQPLDLWLSESPEPEADGKMTVVALTSRPEDKGIFKYQPVREIVQQLLRCSGGGNDISQPSGCIAVFSPLGRCGKTTLARAIALAEPAGTALYIGMEDYSDRQVHSELLYMIRVRAPELWETVTGETAEEAGYACLRLSGMYTELRDVGASDLKWFSEQLLSPGRYSTLIYDVGSAALPDPACLSAFEKIYMPVCSDPVAVQKLEVFRSEMYSLDLGDIWKKLLQVEIPARLTEGTDPREIVKCIR